MFVKIFKVGENSDQVSRHRGNVINYSVNPSSMKILHKDHKAGEEIQTRRLNGPGMNVNLSNFVLELLEPIAEEMSKKAERGSTEAVLSLVDSYNGKVDEEIRTKVCKEILEDILGSVTGDEEVAGTGSGKGP